MKSAIHRSAFLFGFLISAIPAMAQDTTCPSSVASLESAYLEGNSVCAVRQRYEAVVGRLAQKNIDASRIAGVLGPRFIQYNYWRQVGGSKRYDPWIMYQPAPKTWAGWEAARSIVDSDAKSNVASERIEPLTIERIENIHRAGMIGLIGSAGALRAGAAGALYVDRAYAPSKSYMKILSQRAYPSLRLYGNPFMTWHPTLCTDELSPQFKRAHEGVSAWYWKDEPEMRSNGGFTTADGEQRECGYILYAPAEEINEQLRAWFDATEEKRRDLMERKIGDPVLNVAKSQKWFIAIHPFEDGNGRTSRFIMDYFIESLGLPAPILADVDRDLFSTDEEWAGEIGRGILSTIKFLEKCDLTPEDLECHVVANTPN